MFSIIADKDAVIEILEARIAKLDIHKPEMFPILPVSGMTGLKSFNWQRNMPYKPNDKTTFVKAEYGLRSQIDPANKAAATQHFRHTIHNFIRCLEKVFHVETI